MRAGPLAVFAVFLAATACHDTPQSSDLTAPADPSKIILDGAHGGNKDFFFLPPLVPLPLNNPNFQLGKFNNTLRSAIRVDICELDGTALNAQGLPTETTACVAGPALKTFPAGSVNLVNLPLRQGGWWALFNLPPDGFYYVLWDTRQSNLNVAKFYRIQVFVEGASFPLGVADVDPMASLREWKYTKTGQVIQLVNGVFLPIPFRIQQGALCGTATTCQSTVVTNNDPSGFQTVTVDGGAGAIAGAKFPNGWLPANGPQSVVVTIAQVDLGAANAVTGEETKPCHAGLALQQFPDCFNYTTTPRLASIDESGRQFAIPVTVAVCYSLQGSGDPREKFAEMYASGPNEPPHALVDVSDVGILSPATRDCTTTIIGLAPEKGVGQFARATWRSVKSGLGSLFGVKTAYAVDLGLGGSVTEFSNVGTALTANLRSVDASIDFFVPAGGPISPYVRTVGSNHHDGEHSNSTGIGGLPVRYAVGEGNGSLLNIGDEFGGVAALDLVTNTLPINDGPTSGGGYAGANWIVPHSPGTYHLQATSSKARGGPINFSAHVLTDGAYRDCSLLGQIQSTDGSVPTSIQITNNTGEQVSVYWLDYNGAQVLYRSLESGTGYVQQTFVTHPWYLIGLSGKCYGIFLSNATPTNVVIP